MTIKALEQIHQAVRILCDLGQVYELRIPGTRRGTVSGYFNDLDKLASVAARYSGKAPGVYITANPVNESLLGRSNNRVKEFTKHTTADKDIVRRTTFPLDFDPTRPAGISATDEEHQAAVERARECKSWLRELGWPEPVVGNSGNGAHLVYRVDLPNDDVIRDLFKQCFQALAVEFNDSVVAVDPTPYNAARIWKLYGTQVCKGENLPERPHRIAQILEAPDSLELVQLEQLEALAAMRPDKRRRDSSSGTPPGRSHGSHSDYRTLDIVRWFQGHDKYGRLLERGKHAVECPWSSEHSDQRDATDSDTVIWEGDGVSWPRFHCSHANCHGRNLQDVMKVWPDADGFCAKEFGPSNPGSNGQSSKAENLTSDYKNPLSEVRLRRVSAAELQAQALSGELPPIEKLSFLGQQAISPFIRGWSHLFYGYPKSGKTELLTRAANEWGRQGMGVLYITEEPEMVWAARLAGFPKGFENVSLMFAMGASIEEMFHEISTGPETIIVIDTLRLLRLSDENDNSVINLALTPLIASCRGAEKTLIMGHHTRKGSGEHGEAAAGGHAFLGIVDVAVELLRDKQSSKRRIVKGWGRVVDVPEIMYELQDDGSMTVLGDPGAVALENVKDALMECLAGDWQTTKQLREGLGEPKPSVDQVNKALKALGKENEAERDPPLSKGSKSGATYKWRLANPTSDNPSLISEVRLEVLPSEEKREVEQGRIV